MVDKEIIKALECCQKDDCDNCPNTFGNCYANLAGYALDLINRQQTEIDRLKKYNTDVAYKHYHDGIKEFAERLIDEAESTWWHDGKKAHIDSNVSVSVINKIKEEMVGADNV